MIGITTSSSTKIIKKGDYFSIYVDITNGEADEIKLTKVKLFQPIGFTLAPINKQFTIIDAIKETIKSISLLEGKFELKRSDEAIRNIDELPGTPYIEVSRPTIEQTSDIIIQPKDTYRIDFNLKAGWSGGLRPRPDTYIISSEVEYHIKDKLAL